MRVHSTCINQEAGSGGYSIKELRETQIGRIEPSHRRKESFDHLERVHAARTHACVHNIDDNRVDTFYFARTHSRDGRVHPGLCPCESIK